MSRQKWRKANGYRWGRAYSRKRHIRGCRVLIHRYLGAHDIYSMIAKGSPFGWDPNSPTRETGALGGNLIKPFNMRRTGSMREWVLAEMRRINQVTRELVERLGKVRISA